MSLPKKVGKIIASVLLYVIVFDVIGAVASFFFDVAPLRGRSLTLFYAIWFVLGVFCGLLSFNTSGSWISPKGDKDWTNGAGAKRTGWFILGVSTLVIAALLGLGYEIIWKSGAEGDLFVPDSMPLSLTFFITIILAMILGITLISGPTTPIKLAPKPPQ